MGEIYVGDSKHGATLAGAAHHYPHVEIHRHLGDCEQNHTVIVISGIDDLENSILQGKNVCIS